MKRRSQQHKPRPKKFKDGALYFYNSEHVCVKHAQSGKLSFSNLFIVYVWTGENGAKTLQVDANFFENGEKKLRFQTNTDTCGQGLRNFGRDKMVRR